MKRVFSLLAGLAVICTLSPIASAQPPFSNTTSQQTVSPYLNLLNRQGLGLPNYQTLVRPQLQTDQNFARQQSQIQRLQRQQQAGLTAGGLGAPRGISTQIRGTGQISHNRFMETSHYFPIRQ
jgi:hypothetical protein